MANIKLKGLLTEAEDFKARSKETGKLVHFKSKDAYQAAIKAGSHEDPKAEKGAHPKADAKPNDMFGGDYAKDRGGKSETDKVDVKSIVKGIMKTANPEFKGTHKLSDITADIEIDVADADGKELQSRIDKGEDGIYVQTDETEGTVVFSDGTQYQFHHVEDGPIPVTKVGGNTSAAKANTPKSNTKHVSVKPDSEEVQTIAKLTGVREKFIADYINKHKLDAAALSNFTKKGPLQDRLSVGRAMVGDPGNKYEKELIKKFGAGKSQSTATSLPKKASQLSDKHTKMVQDIINAETGLDGLVQVDDNTGTFMFNSSPGDEPTYTLFIGSNEDYGKPDEFRVSFESTYGQDPGGFRNNIDKSFKTAEEAMAFAVKVAKKYKSELELDDNIRFRQDYNMYDDEDTSWTTDKKTESTKLTSMIKK